MPTIAGIHGIAQQYRGGAMLRHVWHPALQGGLTAAGYRDVAEELAADDLCVAFYGDLFRPKAALGGEFPPLLLTILSRMRRSNLSKRCSGRHALAIRQLVLPKVH